ncbi:MAG TPA: hypothetical protein V6D47_06935 [Oscillatoriaceae cyanobacterium]
MLPVTNSQPTTAPKQQDPNAKQVIQSTENGLSNGSSVVGFAQDSTRVGSMVYKGASNGARGIRVVANLVNGEHDALDAAIDKARAQLQRLAGKISPEAAARVDRAAEPTLNGASTAFKVVSRGAQIVGVPFTAMDVYHAVKDKGKDKNAAIANASFSVLGTGSGIAACFLLSTPFGLPLLLTSATTGGVQLLDTFGTNGKIMNFLGTHVVAPIRKLL